MAFMYLGEHKQPQDWASMLAGAASQGLNTFNQLQYQKDLPEYKIAMEKLKNMQLVQGALESLGQTNPDLRTEALTGIPAGRMSPESATREGDLAWAAKVGSPGGMPWQQAQNTLSLQGQNLSEGEQKLEGMRRENRVGNVLEPSAIAVGQMAPEKEKAGISNLRALTEQHLANTQKTTVETSQLPAELAIKKQMANTSASGVGAHWAQVGVAGREADTHALAEKNKEAMTQILLKKEEKTEVDAFQKTVQAAQKDVFTAMKAMDVVAKDPTLDSATKAARLGSYRNQIAGEIDMSIANIRILPATETALKKGSLEGVSKTLIDLSNEYKVGAINALKKGDMDMFAASNLSFNSTIEKLQSLATEVPGAAISIKLMKDNMLAEQKKFQQPTTMERLQQIGSFGMIDPGQFRQNALREALKYQQPGLTNQ